MEQKTLLAIVLSVLVLIGYNTIFSQPNAQQQVIAPQEQKKEQLPSPEPKTAATQTGEPVQLTAEETKQSEDLQVIENKEITTVSSNIGGSLKSVTINKYNHTLPLTNIFSIKRYKNAFFKFEGIQNKKATYRYRNQDVDITKTFDLSKDKNLIVSTIIIKNISDKTISEQWTINDFTLDENELTKKPDSPRDRYLFEYAAKIGGKVKRKGNATKFSSRENKEIFGPVEWSGFRDRYFTFVLHPDEAGQAYETKVLNEKAIQISRKTNEIKLAPRESRTLTAVAYVGPQEIKELQKYNMGFDEIMVYSNWGILDFISKSIVKIMNVFHKFIPNWGLCIILISFLIYGAMYPLTFKAMISMKRMQALQPHITRMREQYKNNPQRLNKETMELYKKYKINPLGGCFPFLLQMPVFIGLYQTLWRTVSFKGSGFLWIQDLSMPDHLLKFPVELPIIGQYLNILPILMMIIMFFQQKLSQKNMQTTDPNQLAQQRIMAIFFPFFLGFIFYKFASGLTLYFTMFYLFSTATQWKMSKIQTEI